MNCCHNIPATLKLERGVFHFSIVVTHPNVEYITYGDGYVGSWYGSG